jgi:Na+/H+ antiporter NhaA
MAEGRFQARLRARARRSLVARAALLPAFQFIRVEEIAGLPLVIAALVAVVWASSPWGDSYRAFWDAKLQLQLGPFARSESLRHWIDDVLLPAFFLVAGMEIKRELVRGELAGLRRAAIPLATALGGMVVPALLYLALNAGLPTARGWGIPMATDVAFALAVLGLAGKRVPAALRVLVLAFAAVDDLGAVLVIGLVYAGNVRWVALAVAGGFLVGILGARWLGLRGPVTYAVLGLGCWGAFLVSGLHPTIAGVAVGLVVAAQPDERRPQVCERIAELSGQLRRSCAAQDGERQDALLGQLEELVHGTEAPVDRLVKAFNPWVSYAILPLFALANAGVAVSPSTLARAATDPAAQGVVLGLVVGKPLGFGLAAWLMTRLGLGRLPSSVRARHVVGGGLVAGIGFTVSLFMAELAFGESAVADDVRMGVLVASVLAGALAWSWLKLRG